jgi:hypothetical protein
MDSKRPLNHKRVSLDLSKLNHAQIDEDRAGEDAAT